MTQIATPQPRPAVAAGPRALPLRDRRRGRRPRPLGFAGIDGGEVYALGDGRIAGVVSDLPDRKVRPERRRLAAHHEVHATS